jgi:hypothetical protein
MCFLLWSGNVFLLHLIQNRIVDQSRLADVCRQGDEGRTIVDSVQLFQRLCISNRNVIKACARFRLDRLSNHIRNPARISFAILEGFLAWTRAL